MDVTIRFRVLNGLFGKGFAGVVILAAHLVLGAEGKAPKRLSMTDLLAGSAGTDWRKPDLENTLYLNLATGRVVIELAPAFAPRHVSQVKMLAREKYYDGLAIVRAQDNYVVQLADPDVENSEKIRPIRSGARYLQAEFDRVFDRTLPFAKLPDRDVYAKEVGFSAGFPVARDRRTGRMWLVHRYGMLGAGRDNDPNSGGGTELYVVIGHAPRHLDRNVTLFGCVLQGMELLSVLPRGSGPMGFYGKPEEKVGILSVRVAADVPEAERTNLEVLRTDTPLFGKLVESRRRRPEAWFQVEAGRIEIGNVPVPVRQATNGLAGEIRK